MYKTITIAVLQVGGAISITAGVAILNAAAGAITGGILAVAFGVAMERGNAK